MVDTTYFFDLTKKKCCILVQDNEGKRIPKSREGLIFSLFFLITL